MVGSFATAMNDLDDEMELLLLILILHEEQMALAEIWQDVPDPWVSEDDDSSSLDDESAHPGA